MAIVFAMPTIIGLITTTNATDLILGIQTLPALVLTIAWTGIQITLRAAQAGVNAEMDADGMLRILNVVQRIMGTGY